MKEKIFEKKIGVVGGGQLGRMLGEAASPLGVEILVMDPTPNCPAYPPASDQIVNGFNNKDGYYEIAEKTDILTYEIETADPDILEEVYNKTNIPVHPSPNTLRITQDKLIEKNTLKDNDIPVPNFKSVDNEDDLLEAFDDLGSPVMLKARKGGYDGRGNARIRSVNEAKDEFGSLDNMIAEELIDFERELSVIGVKGKDNIMTFPVGENIHKKEILRETIVPARTGESVRELAVDISDQVLDVVEGRGVYGIELFETSEQKILVNEIAPRPHNSGHYTIEGNITSQFEQHVRAILGLPLGATNLRQITVIGNILGDVEQSKKANLRGVEDILNMPSIKLHWYGKKEVRPLRKMGHITSIGKNKENTIRKIRKAKKLLTFQDE